MTFAANLRRFRLSAKMTQEALALACGWPGQSRIANYEKDGFREPSLEDVALIAGALSITKSQLLGETKEALTEKDGWADIQGYSQAVGLGKGAEAQDYAETHKLKFKADSLTRKGLFPNNLVVMYGHGDSMLPRIKEGDALLFDTSDKKPQHERIFIVQVGKEIYAKRCLVLDDLVFFDSLNSNGDHRWNKAKRMDSKHDPVQIIGRVRWIGSWED